MSGFPTLVIDKAIELAEHVASKLADRTGFDRAITFEVAKAAAAEWVLAERKAVTSARDAAVAEADKRRAAQGTTKREG